MALARKGSVPLYGLGIGSLSWRRDSGRICFDDVQPMLCLFDVGVLEVICLLPVFIRLREYLILCFGGMVSGEEESGSVVGL